MTFPHAPTPGTAIPELKTPWYIHVQLYPQHGQPNTTRHMTCDQDKLHALLHFDSDGVLDGLLTYLDGQVVVRVRPDRQRQGIGAELTRDARSRWPVDRAKQLVTPEGSRLVASNIRKEQTHNTE